MEVLMTGKGTSGSWQIRGVQIAAALGARAIPMASLDQCREADVIVGVKRIPPSLLANIRMSGRPFVWDCVDAYPQPACSTWDRERSISWLADTENYLKPDRVIYPNARMRDDANSDGWPVIYHHARPGQRRNPIRPVKVIGYEGGEQYLGRWRAVIARECAERGWSFVINPAGLAYVDIVLALRDCGGYAPRNWKSNVKLANAQGSGTPVICNRETGYLETASGAEQWADTAQELSEAFDALSLTAVRRGVAERLFAAAPTLDSVATTYLQWLRSNF